VKQRMMRVDARLERIFAMNDRVGDEDGAVKHVNVGVPRLNDEEGSIELLEAVMDVTQQRRPQPSLFKPKTP